MIILAGYQGAGSVHTAGLRRFGAALHGAGVAAEVLADVTAAGGTASGLFAAVEQGGGPAICYLASGYLSARVPSLRALDLPFAAAERSRLLAALDGAAGRRIAAELRAATGLLLLGIWDNGTRHLSNGIRPIRAPRDCAGLTVRTLDNAIYQDAMASFGFRPVVTDPAGLRAAVASGAVDAQENPLTNILGFGLHQYHRHVSLTGHIQGFALLVANGAWAEALTPPERDGVLAAAAAATGVQREAAAAADAAAMATLTEAGVAVLREDELDLPAFRAASAPVRARALSGIDPGFLALLD